MIIEHLEPLFYITKDLKGNADLQEGAGKASHGALWETLLVFESLLSHFKILEDHAKAGDFHENPCI